MRAAVHLHLHLGIHLRQATLVTVVFALGSAVCFGVSSALQYRSSNQEETTAPLDPSLLIKLVHNRLWLLGAVADAAGLGLQVLALNKGSLVLVEPLLTVSILVATPLGAAMDHRRTTRREMISLLAVVVGLGAFLAVAQPDEGSATLQPRLVYSIFFISTGVIGLCLVLAMRGTGPSLRRGVLIALAGGVALGASSALIKSVTTLIGSRGFGVVAHPATYALIVLGTAALLLTQNAFQAGPLGPTLAILTVTEPVVGVAVGLVGLHEVINNSPLALALECLTALVTLTGLVVLSLESGRRHGASDEQVPVSEPPVRPG